MQLLLLPEQLQSILDWKLKRNMPEWEFLPVQPVTDSFTEQKDVAVVGGGDTAAEEATYLAGLCNKVYLIVRRDVLQGIKSDAGKGHEYNKY